MTTTETPAGTELSPAALATWAKLRAVQTQLADLKVEEETLKGQLREHLGVGTYSLGGQKLFSITPQRKWDETAARAILTAEEIAACTVPVLDRALVQKIVAPARYAACQTEGGKPVVRAA